MQRMLAIAVAGFAQFATPTLAFAQGAGGDSVSLLHLGTSLTGLLVAIFLLLEALAVRRVASGGAVADKISYVILAIVCLAASALAQWTGNFVDGLSFDQTQLAGEVLVIVAMALLTAYFYSVRVAMQNYLKIMQSSLSAPEAYDQGADPNADAPLEDEAEPRG